MPVGIGYVFEFHIPNVRYKGLLLYVTNFNTTSDENDFINQFYLLYSDILWWDFRILISRKSDKESFIPQIRYMGFEKSRAR